MHHKELYSFIEDFVVCLELTDINDFLNRNAFPVSLEEVKIYNIKYISLRGAVKLAVRRAFGDSENRELLETYYYNTIIQKLNNIMLFDYTLQEKTNINTLAVSIGKEKLITMLQCLYNES